MVMTTGIWTTEMTKCYRIVIFTVLFFIGAGFLSACGNDSSTTAPKAAVKTESPTSLYLKTVRNEYPVLNNVSDSSLVGMSKTACTMFAQGDSLADVANLALSAGFTPDQLSMVGYIVGAGTATYCPEYSSVITGEQGS